MYYYSYTGNESDRPRFPAVGTIKIFVSKILPISSLKSIFWLDFRRNMMIPKDPRGEGVLPHQYLTINPRFQLPNGNAPLLRAGLVWVRVVFLLRRATICR
jgi:hypothetical protein